MSIKNKYVLGKTSQVWHCFSLKGWRFVLNKQIFLDHHRHSLNTPLNEHVVFCVLVSFCAAKAATASSRCLSVYIYIHIYIHMLVHWPVEIVKVITLIVFVTVVFFFPTQHGRARNHRRALASFLSLSVSAWKIQCVRRRLLFVSLCVYFLFPVSFDMLT